MTSHKNEFQNKCGRVVSMVHALEELPDTASREAARDLIRAVFELHAAGLERILDLAGVERASGYALDPVVSGLLLLHGLHPLPAEVRVRRELDGIRDHFHAIGGDVELLSATEESVLLRLRGNPTAERTLRALAGEAVIEAVPDATVVEFDAAWDRDPSGRVALHIIT